VPASRQQHDLLRRGGQRTLADLIRHRQICGQRLRRLGEHTVQIGYEPELFLRLGEGGPRLGGSAVLVVHSEFDHRVSCS
jgi:hypothetical protein